VQSRSRSVSSCGPLELAASRRSKISLGLSHPMAITSGLLFWLLWSTKMHHFWPRVLITPPVLIPGCGSELNGQQPAAWKSRNGADQCVLVLIYSYSNPEKITYGILYYKPMMVILKVQMLCYQIFGMLEKLMFFFCVWTSRLNSKMRVTNIVLSVFLMQDQIPRPHNHACCTSHIDSCICDSPDYGHLLGK